MNKLSIRTGGVATTISPLQLYLQEIAKYPLLEPEEEFEYARQHYEEGDAGAAHRLITANLRLVVKIANDFHKAQNQLLDLIQEGNYGLMQAVKKFNPYKGVKLSSYAAWWIRAYILKYLLNNKGQVRIATTAAQRKLFYNLRKETDRLIAEYSEADPKLIAERLDVAEKDVVEMQKRLGSSDVSIDAPAQEGSDRPTVEVVDDRLSAEEFLAGEEVRRIFRQHLDDFSRGLSGRDAEIFQARLLSDKPATLQEIGDRFGVSRERARQLEARLIKRLKAFVTDQGTLDVAPVSPA